MTRKDSAVHVSLSSDLIVKQQYFQAGITAAEARFRPGFEAGLGHSL
jgi:hypothetical protein